MLRPVHFEIHTSDPDTSIAFYEGLFGWTFTQWGDIPYWLVQTGPDTEPGIDGGLVPRAGGAPTSGGPGGDGPDSAQPVNAWVVTVDVPDCQAYVDKAVAGGGTVAFGRAATKGVGWLAYVKDPDGNLLGLMQNDPSAA